jgi:type I restriction enzyme S subunit
MVSEWKNTILKEPLEFSNGRTSPTRVESGQFAVFGSNGAIGRASEANSPARTIIIGRVGSYCGSLHYSSEPCWVTDNAIKAVARTGHNPEFLRYLLLTLDLNNWRGGSGQPLLNQGTLNAIPISLPPSDEQNKIGAFLGALDTRVSLIADMNSTLESIARSIFKSWFVDFDPVRTKAEGREPEGMDAATAALFPSKFVDSQLGAVPEGWTAMPLYEIASFSNGAAYKDIHFSPSTEGLPVIKIAELKAGVTGSTRFTEVDLGARYRIEQNEILFSWSGNPDTSIDTFIWDGGPAWLNQHIFRVRENGTVPRSLIYIQLKALRPTFAEIARDKQTTGLGHVTIGDMKRLMVCKPAKELTLRFDEIVEPTLEKIAVNQSVGRALASLRDTLVPRLITGKLRLPEAEKLVEAML